MSKPKELQGRIDQLRKEIAHIAEHRSTKFGSDVQVAQKQSEIFVASSQLAEMSTRRLVRLTWAIVALTAALLFLTAYLCYDAYLNDKSEGDTGQSAA